MADVRPFRALRPRADLVEKVAVPPYDVVSTEEARAMAGANPYCYFHVSKPEIGLPPETDPYDDRVYARGRENLQRLVRDGVLLREAEPRFYLYQQRMGDHVQAGLVAAASCAEYEAGRIKKHEHTRKDKEDDRTRHTRELNANAGPVFLTYRKRPQIDAIVDGVRRTSPLYDFTPSDGVSHTVWLVPPDAGERLRAALGAVEALYIADGHHRAASGARVARESQAANPGHTGEEAYNFFLAALFPHDQLRIMDYNRVVKDLAGLSEEAFLERIRWAFDVAPAERPRPDAPHRFGMHLNGRWLRLSARPGSFPAADPVRSLDATILQENVLAPVLGIADPRKDKRIDFVGGIRGTEELEKRVRGGWAAAFALFPVTLDQLLSVADAGMIMPPKSTWFEPKLRSGLLVRSLESW